MKMTIAVMTSCENAPTTPIGYKIRVQAMMAMVTAVVHQVEVLLEVVVEVVWPKEEEARWFATTVTRLGI